MSEEIEITSEEIHREKTEKFNRIVIFIGSLVGLSIGLAILLSSCLNINKINCLIRSNSTITDHDRSYISIRCQGWANSCQSKILCSPSNNCSSGIYDIGKSIRIKINCCRNAQSIVLGSLFILIGIFMLIQFIYIVKKYN
jgi:hypothetical protein